MPDFANVINQVGHKLGIGSPDSSTYPTKATIGEYLNAGQYEMVDILDQSLLPDLTSRSSISFTSHTASLPASYQTYLVAYDANNVFKYVDTDIFAITEADTNAYYGKSEPVITIEGGELRIAPSYSDTSAVLVYKKYPTAYSSNSSTSIDLPTNLVPYLVDYCYIQAKLQEEETQQAISNYQMWVRRLKLLNLQAIKKKYEG